MKAVYICFIYAIHIFIVYWLVKRFLVKSRNFIANIIIMLIVFDWWIQHVQLHVYSASSVRFTQTRHHHAIIYAFEKTIYRLKKTIYGYDLDSSE